jgi:hypothetical protein
MKAVAFAVSTTLGLAIGATAQQTIQPDGQDRAGWIDFEQADKNRDGRVNRAEGAAFADSDFSSADANGDLVLSRPEFAAAMARAAVRSDGQPAAGNGNRTHRWTSRPWTRTKTTESTPATSRKSPASTSAEPTRTTTSP